MATQIQIVNKLLSRLREDEVSSVSSSAYAKLMGIFVNDAKADLEDMWFWSVNETAVSTSVLSDGTRTYDLTETTDRSWLIRYINDHLPLAYDTTADEENQLRDIPLKELRRWRGSFKGTPEDVEAPREFAIVPDADGRGYSLELKQGSNTARTWTTYWYVPQADLELDGTDDATEILLPERPIYLRALWYAANERGEEMGEPGSMLEVQANLAAAAAMEIDMQVNKKSDDSDITNLEVLRNRIYGAMY